MPSTRATAITDRLTRPRTALLVLCAAGGLNAFEVAKTNAALPALVSALDPGPVLGQGLTTGFFLAMALTLIPGALLGDRAGRRRVLLVGVLVLGAASLLGATGTSIEAVVAARVLGGAAIGLSTPQAIGLLTGLFDGGRRAGALAAFGAALSFSFAAGPFVGGALIAALPVELGWRAVLLSGAVLAGLLVAGTVSTIPADTGRRSRASLRARVEMLRGTGFVRGTAVSAAYFAGMPGLFLALTLLLQEGRAWGPLAAAAVVAGYAVLSGALSFLLPRIRVDRRGAALTASLILVVASDAVLAVIAPWSDPRAFAIGLAVAVLAGGAGNAGATALSQMMALSRVPAAAAGLAGAVLVAAQRLATVVGMTVVTSLAATGSARAAFPAPLLVLGATALVAAALLLPIPRRRLSPSPIT